MTSELVGRGWTYPCVLTVDGAVGLSEGGPELSAAIRMIIATAPGERVMRPDFGCTIWEYVFEPVNGRTIGMMEQAVREAVVRWEPRVELESVSAVAVAEERVDLTLTFRVRATNDYRNLVYPFYVIPQEVDAT